MNANRSPKRGARERILETADRLFYSEGFGAVGVDRVVAEAGVAKMSLYNHFPSKDDLILAVLEYREEKVLDMFERSMAARVAEGMDRMDAFFAALKDWFESPGFRGCAFINARAELAGPGHPAAKFSAAHKARFRRMIREIAEETAGRKAGAAAAPAIALLAEGAIVEAMMEENSKPADVAGRAARRLLSAARRP